MNKYEPTGFAAQIFQDRYAIHSKETFEQACKRVADYISWVEEGSKRDKYANKFLEILLSNKFSPGGRIWRGAGRKRGQMLNCFVIPVEDSREGWGDALRNVTIISGTGGGVGLNFSKIRPRGTPIRGTGGEATGAVSLMKMINSICDELREGGGRRCLPLDCLVHTQRGLICIKDLIPGDKVQILDGSFSPVIVKEFTGIKKIVNIHTQMGDFRSSEDHRWAVLDDIDGSIKWVEAKNLNKNDRLMFMPHGIEGVKTSLPTYEYNKPKMATRYNNIEIPELTTEIAWFIGNIHGDGCVEEKSVSIACADDLPQQVQRSVQCFKSFGIEARQKKNGDEKCTRVIGYSKQLSEYIGKFKQPHTSIDIPKFILEGTVEIRSAYIAGLLDSDGCLSKTTKKSLPTISSVYPDFLRQVRAVLSSLGILSKIHLIREGLDNWKPLYNINIFTIESLEIFEQTVCQYSSKYELHGLHKRIKEQCGITMPRELIAASSARSDFHVGYWSKSNDIECSFSKFESVVGKQEYRPIKIHSIDISEQLEETVDIQVLDDEMFIVEGMLVHNSALMFCLNWDHPDLLEFLKVKLDKKELSNANISVCIDNMFLKLLEEDQQIVFKWQGEERGKARAREVWDKIVANSLESGDPGLLNIGLANELNPISYVANLVSTNPCGEIWMQPYDCCCLGAMVLSNHVTNRRIDWDMLEETVSLSVRFLDNVLDQNCYPLPQIEETCQKNRRIGLGVMGLHDMLLKMGYKYSSNNAIQLVDELMEFIKKRAYDTSIELAIEKGPFHNCDPQQHTKTKFAKRCLTASLRRRIEQHGIRNCSLLTIAPTGTTSIVSGCSSGVEPLFELVYKRNFNEHSKQHNKDRESSNEIIIHPLVQEFIEKELSTRHFESAHDITPDSHLAMQYTCQKHVDNAISKTINLPHDFSTDDLSDIIQKYIYDLKGITIYREGSKGNPPLISVSIEEAKKFLGTINKRASVNDCPKGNCEIT